MPRQDVSAIHRKPQRLRGIAGTYLPKYGVVGRAHVVVATPDWPDSDYCSAFDQFRASSANE
jgi:hypothetical protein